MSGKARAKVIDEIIADIADNKKIIEYNNGLGIVNFQNKSLMRECELLDFLKLIKDDGYENDMIKYYDEIASGLQQSAINS